MPSLLQIAKTLTGEKRRFADLCSNANDKMRK